MNPDQKTQQKKNLLGCSAILLVIIGLVYFILKWNSSDSKDYSENTSISEPNQGKTTVTLPNDPYDVIHTVFIGKPDKKDVQPLMEAEMKSHNFTVNDDNVLKFGNMLLTLRKDSKVGVTEMEILKHMYQHDDPSKSLAEQAAISSVILEKTK